jgi:CRP/FNR family transcriptional regulator
MDLIGAVLDTELFEGFDRKELAPLGPHLRTRWYQRGVYLWHAGDPVVAACLVSSGLVKVRRIELDGHEAVLQLIVPGETVGEFPLFEEGARRMYDAVAVEPTETVVISRDHLMFLLERNPKLTMKLAASMMRRLMREHGAMTDIQLVDLEARLARRLLALVKIRGEPAKDGTRIGVRLSQSLLASTVRASRENVNRALRRMAEERLVEMRDGYLLVRDEEALERLGRR